MCKSDPHITLHAAHEVTGYDQDDAGVTVHTANGRSFAGIALIGCDGVRSKVRETIVGDGLPKISGHVAYRAVLPIEEMPEELRWNAACLWAGPKCHMVHYPLRGWKLFNIVATFHHPTRTTEGHNEPGDRDELLSYFRHLPVCRAACSRSRATGAAGCWATAIRSATGPTATSRCWATPRIRRTSTSRRARAWPSRTRSS